MIDFNVILFDNFETLDAFGPAEIIGKLVDDYKPEYYSLKGGLVTSAQNIRVQTIKADQMKKDYVLLVPGGMGTRSLVNDTDFIQMLRQTATNATWVLSVCTGSGLLAKAGLLKGKRATSNKRAFDWAVSNDPAVDWVKKARWVQDGNIYTSSGVSAGMDMMLGFIADRHGTEVAEEKANAIEYIWNKDHAKDPFCNC